MSSLFEPCVWAAAALFALSLPATVWWLREQWREWRKK